MAMHGVAQVMIGTTLPEIIRSFNLSLSQGGFIVSVQAAGGMLIMFLGMVFADKIHKPVWIIGSVAAVGALMVVTGLSPAYWFLLVVFFVTGIAVQMMDSLLNALTGEIASPPRSRQLSILHMLYGIGAFVGPTFARILLNGPLQWNAVYWIMGGVYLLAAASSLVWMKWYSALVPRSAPRGAGGIGRAEGASPVVEERTPVNAGQEGLAPGAWATVIVMGLVVLFYAVHQLGTTSWLPLYMETVLGVNVNLASISLSLYWVGIIVSRLLASVLGHRIGETRILIWGSVLGGLALIGVVLLGYPVLAIVGFVFAGIVTGATIPLVMALAYGCVPSRTGSVTSVIYGLMMIGRLAGPWTMGKVGDALGLGAGIMIAAAVLLVVALCSAIAMRMRRRMIA